MVFVFCSFFSIVNKRAGLGFVTDNTPECSCIHTLNLPPFGTRFDEALVFFFHIHLYFCLNFYVFN